MRKRHIIKSRDPADEIAYAEEFKKIVEKARANMKVFDKLPPVVRHAMTEEPTGSISVNDVCRYVGTIPDQTLARAVIENGKAGYREFMEMVAEDENARARQRAARSLPDYESHPVPAPKKARTKKPRK